MSCTKADKEIAKRFLEEAKNYAGKNFTFIQCMTRVAKILGYTGYNDVRLEGVRQCIISKNGIKPQNSKKKFSAKDQEIKIKTPPDKFPKTEFVSYLQDLNKR